VSYDLLFAIKKGKRFEAKRVDEKLKKRRNWMGSAGSQWLYQNAETGVYGSLDISAFDDEERLPAGFEHVPLSANLNFARPSFFGHEFLPEVAWLATELDLFVIDPQSEGLGAGVGPKQAVAAELVACWERNNVAATAALAGAQHSQHPRMARDAAMAAWRYMYARDQIQKKVGDSVYACRVAFMKHRGSTNVLRFVSWVEGNPSVLPEADLVALATFVEGSEKAAVRGTIPMKELLKGLGDAVTSRSFEVPGLAPQVVVTPQRAAVAAERAAALPVTPIQDMEGVAPDGFVDG
jgi:hypothetical protein